LVTAGGDLATGIVSNKASTANSEGMDLTAASKRYEAIFQQLSGIQQQDSDSLIAINNRANEMQASLMRTISDVNSAFARVRFAS